MILARHAEALYWAGRKVERAEQTTRLLDVCGRNAMHIDPDDTDEYWRVIVDILGLTGYRDVSGAAPEASVESFLFAEATNPGSVIVSVTDLRENVRAVRDRVPVELWEEANRLYVALTSPDAMATLADEPFGLFQSIRRGCQAITGVVAEAMPRDEGHTFFVVGRMIERSITTCRVSRLGALDTGLIDGSTILRVAASLQAYRRSAGYDDDPLRMARFLLTAEDVPRSVLSCLRQAQSRLETLEAHAIGIGPGRKVCGRIVADLEYDDVESELARDAVGYVTRVEGDVGELGRLLSEYAFSPAQSSMVTAHFVRPGTET